MKIDFSSDTYQATHGHAPRGQGSWSVTLYFEDGTRRVWKSRGSFGECKRLATLVAKREGAHAIDLNPYSVAIEVQL